jgi:hypothetical protein
MDDVNENALIVNAVQRRADVVVQKSLPEGFGLTVTEAMWKGDRSWRVRWVAFRIKSCIRRPRPPAIGYKRGPGPLG